MLLAQIAPATTSYPLDVILNESRDTCALLIGAPDGNEVFTSRGWSPVDKSLGGWLAQYIGSNRDLGQALSLQSYDSVFQKRFANRDLILYVFGLAAAGSARKRWGSCEVMDLTASGSITNDTVRRWAGREPQPNYELGSNVLLRWVPSLSPGGADSSITYSPADSPLASLRPGLIYTLVMLTGKQNP